MHLKRIYSWEHCYINFVMICIDFSIISIASDIWLNLNDVAVIIKFSEMLYNFYKQIEIHRLIGTECKLLERSNNCKSNYLINIKWWIATSSKSLKEIECDLVFLLPHTPTLCFKCINGKINIMHFLIFSIDFTHGCWYGLDFSVWYQMNYINHYPFHDLLYNYYQHKRIPTHNYDWTILIYDEIL